MIWLQTPTVFWLGRGTIFLSYSVYLGLVMLGRHKYITAEPLVPELSAFEFEMAIEKLKRHRLPDIDEISAELIKAGGRIIRCEIPKLLY